MTDKSAFSNASNASYSSDWQAKRHEMQTFSANIATSLPVQVVAVHGGGVAPVGYVDIRILVQQITAVGEAVDHGIIYNVPYVRIQGGRNAIIIDPKAGDIGIACFSSRDISSVKNTRNTAPPASRRKHSLSDAMYIGGLLNQAPTQYIEFSDSGIILHTPQNFTVNAGGNFDVNCKKMTIKAASGLEINANTLVNGNITQNGDSATMSGSLTTSGEITAKGISLSTHIHGGVTAGGDKTQGPQ